MTSIKEDKILFYGIKTTRNSNKLVQLKLLTDIKNKLDKIFQQTTSWLYFRSFLQVSHKQNQALFCQVHFWKCSLSLLKYITFLNIRLFDFYISRNWIKYLNCLFNLLKSKLLMLIWQITLLYISMWSVFPDHFRNILLLNTTSRRYSDRSYTFRNKFTIYIINITNF